MKRVDSLSKSERTEQFSIFSDWLLQNAVRAPAMTQDEPQSATHVPFDGQMLQEVFGLDREELHTMLGVVVDAVSEVLTVVAEDIEETPAFGARVNTEFIEGVAKVKGRVMFILNLDDILVAETGRDLQPAARARAGARTAARRVR